MNHFIIGIHTKNNMKTLTCGQMSGETCQEKISAADLEELIEKAKSHVMGTHDKEHIGLALKVLALTPEQRKEVRARLEKLWTEAPEQ